MIETWEIKGYTVEFIEDEEKEIHTYLCNGVVLPSITQILKIKFGDKYKSVDKKVMQRASKLGTATHKAIEDYCKLGIDDKNSKELRNFKFLQKQFNFEVLDNETPIILFKDNKPVACGRLDLVLKINDDLCLGDIKRTATLDKEYLAYQLNLYRIGFQQCYEKEIKGLKGIHLREDVRKYVDIPVNEKMALELLNKYLDERGQTNE